MRIRKTILDYKEGKQLFCCGNDQRISEERLSKKVMRWDSENRKEDQKIIFQQKRYLAITHRIKSLYVMNILTK